MAIAQTSILLIMAAYTSISSARPDDYSQRELNEEKVVASNWQQHSPEYEALVYQSFNMARDNLGNALNQLPKGKRAAIVTDIDDTLIDGTTYFSSMVGTDGARNVEATLAWWKDQRMEALPGALDFLNEVENQGIDIFYISARFNEAKELTMAKLKRLGFPIKGSDYLLFQQTDNKTLSKENQRQIIRDKGYHILMLLGDQLDDLAEVEGHHFNRRQQWVLQNHNRFGKDWIFFPNLVYGSWEHAVVTMNFNQLSPDEKHDANLNALNYSHFAQIQDPSFALHNINAMLWMNSSADYHALTYQAYNQSTRILEKMNRKTMENPAIVVNINGTILQYTPQNPDLSLPAPGSEPSLFSWYLEQQKNAKPIPGAPQFLAAAKERGFEIFYVSEIPVSSGQQGNKKDIEMLTVRKLRELGYPDADETHVLLKGEYCSEVELKNCTKTSQRRAITSGEVDRKKHQIVLYIGDTLSDFGLEENGFDPDLKASVTANKDMFGRQYMVIPNPLNTRRLVTLYSDYAGKHIGDLSSEEQANIRRKLVRNWPAKPF
ncbi:HAD family acid phosphatase [Endozoicomonas sp. 8E]|uniref:HAD family acid phosphatase n=1 Tax=Endozoicomonas sp. 8E TaxID=3035692 RepID=UPI0029392F35|nr:HAD family acid phosphatase [Endozoicomonas sp. 8E]WOG30184.1 HAD family acid phosphatase [Endozoicomonas sp. 8E]